MIYRKDIDGGKGFDWGKTSADYAKYRDIYPPAFYQAIFDLGLYHGGQKILDIGTGTGVLPRNLYQYGAEIIGTDISENQIEQARRMAAERNMDIQFICCPTEKLDFPPQTFDVISACQCFHYFDHDVFAPNAARMLKDDGALAVMFLEWLPFDDKIAGESERLVLKYNPSWSGANFRRKQLPIPDAYMEYFDIAERREFDVSVLFTRESWNGRMKACRGIGASLSTEDIAAFEQEHMRLLETTADDSFYVLHFASIVVLRKKQEAISAK